jgi:phosphate starvation-inducible membrane PsiE
MLDVGEKKRNLNEWMYKKRSYKGIKNIYLYFIYIEFFFLV